MRKIHSCFSKNCSTKHLSDVISKIFKMIFNHVESFYRKRFFYTRLKKFWAVGNVCPIVVKLNKINTSKKAKSISNLGFTTLYTTIPHNFLNTVINFVFKSKTWCRISFSKTSVYWSPKGCGKRYFARQTLIDAISFLITKCYFTIGHLVFKHETCIPMGIDQAP